MIFCRRRKLHSTCDEATEGIDIASFVSVFQIDQLLGSAEIVLPEIVRAACPIGG